MVRDRDSALPRHLHDQPIYRHPGRGFALVRQFFDERRRLIAQDHPNFHIFRSAVIPRQRQPYSVSAKCASWKFFGRCLGQIGNRGHFWAFQRISWATLHIIKSMAYRLPPKAWTGNGRELSFNINALPKKRGFSLHGGGLYCLYVITFAYTDMSLRKGLVQGGQCLGNSGPPPLLTYLILKKLLLYRGLRLFGGGPKPRTRPRTEPSMRCDLWAIVFPSLPY